MWDHLIQAFFKKNGITHPDDLLMRTFMDVMSEERDTPKWISDQGRDFLNKVLDRIEAKNVAKEAAAKKAAAKTLKPKTDKAPVIGQPQLGLPTKPEGN